MENYWLRIVDLLQANKYIEGIPYWKYKEMKTARGDKKRWLCFCQVEPFDSAQDRLRRNLFDWSIELKVFVQTSRLRSRGQKKVAVPLSRPLDCARGDRNAQEEALCPPLSNLYTGFTFIRPRIGH